MIESPEDALKYMRDNAKPLAEAKATRVYLTEYRKSLKGRLCREAPPEARTIDDRNNWAYSHREYTDHLDALRIAVEDEERLKWMMVAAQAKVEIWRSQEASNRAIDKNHQ